jgi:amino acid transporter
MKKISFILLLSSIGIIIYFFIKEQFRGITLSQKENLLLSITYLIVGISLIILFRIKHFENKNKENPKK